MDEVRGSFDHASSGVIATEQELSALAIALFRGQRQYVHVDRFGFVLLAAAIGHYRVVLNLLALGEGDAPVPVEFPGMADDTTNIFGVIEPGTGTRTKLIDAATVFIDDFAGRCSGTFIQRIRHAVEIGVANGRRPELENRAVGAADRTERLACEDKAAIDGLLDRFENSCPDGRVPEPLSIGIEVNEPGAGGWAGLVAFGTGKRVARSDEPAVTGLCEGAKSIRGSAAEGFLPTFRAVSIERQHPAVASAELRAGFVAARRGCRPTAGDESAIRRLDDVSEIFVVAAAVSLVPEFIAI